MSEQSKSPRGQIDSTDLKKIGKGALVAIVGALLTFGTEIISQMQIGQGLGQYTPIVVAAWSVIANAGRKWYANNKTGYNVNLKMLLCVLFISVLTQGCSSAEKAQTINVGTVGGSVNNHIRAVGSMGQEDNPSEMLKAMGEIPLQSALGQAIPFNLLINKTGVESAASMNFDRVEGDWTNTIELIGVGNQNTGSQEIKTASEHINIGELQPQIE